MKKTNYEKVNGKWIVTKRYDEIEISEERYCHLRNDRGIAYLLIIIRVFDS